MEERPTPQQMYEDSRRKAEEEGVLVPPAWEELDDYERALWEDWARGDKERKLNL